MPGFIKQTLIVIVPVPIAFNESLPLKCISMNNPPCIVIPTLIDLNPDEFHYYLFIISLDRYDGSCNTIQDAFVRVCVPNKMEDLNLNVFRSKE